MDPAIAPPSHDNGQLLAQGSTVVFAVGTVLGQLAAAGPSWEQVAPILLGVAALLGSIKSYREGKQKLRHEEEKHRAWMTRIQLGKLEVEELR